MYQVFTLALPFFGVIFLGFVSGKIAGLPRSGLAWLDFFLIYVALPALFFDIISRTPFEELAQGRFIAAIVTSTFTAFLLTFAIGMAMSRGDLRIATFQGLVGSYSNVGYMGPGLVLATLGAGAAAPIALVFCFDVALVFTILPVMMALGGPEKRRLGPTLLLVARRVLTHPFIIATIAGGIAAATRFDTPAPLQELLTFLRNSAAPTALFALGVTVAVQPEGRQALEVPVLVFMKLVMHPLIAWFVLTLYGGFNAVWIKTVILMACLPPAATIFVAAQQYNLYVARAATAILFGVAASVFTVTLVMWLVTTDAIPLQPWGR
jgi:malonate transporter and related proteins